ncbi:hypothetical protein RKU25_00185 [Streptococcus pneumoniae]|nr:hypothetical protein [Streptococcus pneumoniae]
MKLKTVSGFWPIMKKKRIAGSWANVKDQICEASSGTRKGVCSCLITTET